MSRDVGYNRQSRTATTAGGFKGLADLCADVALRLTARAGAIREDFSCTHSSSLPEHFHALITPAPEVSLEKAMQFIKGGFSFRLKSKLDVWMRSFNETQIMAKEKFVRCSLYIEDNPV